MFDNLTGKQGLVFGIISGIGLSAVIGIAIIVPKLSGGNVEAKNLTATIQPSAQIDPSTEQAQPPLNLPKSDKPQVELFVMSKCPYGLQMEKALIPAYDLLKKKADISIKFVSYAMHGKEEVDENTRQYCAQQQNKDKYFSYLKCYATSEDSAACLKSSGLNESNINSCVDKTNKKFNILDKFNDQSTWLSGQYPLYPVDQDLNDKYGVQGSPTLVINGVQAEANRTPDAIKSAICSSFNNPPVECGQTLTLSSPQPGFGAGQTQNATAGGCGS